jgi:hypothetical protein
MLVRVLVQVLVRELVLVFHPRSPYTLRSTVSALGLALAWSDLSYTFRSVPNLHPGPRCCH